MTTSITSGIHSTTPLFVKSWETSQATRNVIHNIVGKSEPDITLKPAGLRTGTFELFYASQEDAENARAVLSLPTVFLVSSDDETWLNDFKFVSVDSISAALDETDLTSWHFSVGFQEVT